MVLDPKTQNVAERCEPKVFSPRGEERVPLRLLQCLTSLDFGKHVREWPKRSTVTKIVTKSGVKQTKINEPQKTGTLLSDGWQRDLVEFVSDSEVDHWL
jgi:hypothetical protein